MRDFGGNVDEVVEMNGETLGFRHSDEMRVAATAVFCFREREREEDGVGNGM